MKLPEHIQVSNTTIKKAHNEFKSHTINCAIDLLNSSIPLPTIVAEFIDDWSNSELRKCLIFMVARTLNDTNFPYGIYK